MPRKKNSEIDDGAIVSSYSIQRSLKPNLATVAEKLGVPSVSELFSLLAIYPEDAVVALRPLVDKAAQARSDAERAKARQAEIATRLQSLDPDRLEKLLKAAEAS